MYKDNRFLAYNDNSLCFRTTENVDYQLAHAGEHGFTGRVLLEESFFSQIGFCKRSSQDHIKIKNVTALKLIKLAKVVHQRVSSQ